MGKSGSKAKPDCSDWSASVLACIGCGQGNLFCHPRSLILRQCEVGNCDKGTAYCSFECRSHPSLEKRDDVWIIVGDCIHVVDLEVLRIVHVRVGFGSGSETPSAVGFVVRFLAIHEPNSVTVYGNPVSGKTRTVPECNVADLLWSNLE